MQMEILKCKTKLKQKIMERNRLTHLLTLLQVPKKKKQSKLMFKWIAIRALITNQSLMLAIMRIIHISMQLLGLRKRLTTQDLREMMVIILMSMMLLHMILNKMVLTKYNIKMKNSLYYPQVKWVFCLNSNRKYFNKLMKRENWH